MNSRIQVKQHRASERGTSGKAPVLAINVQRPIQNRRRAQTDETPAAHLYLLTINLEMWSSTFLDEAGRPSFNVLQNYGSAEAPVFYYVFDVMMLAGRDVMQEPLASRRKMLEKRILPRLREPIRLSPAPDVGLQDLVRSVREQGLEGLVAKRRDSIYEPGLRSGAWRKMRINLGQEFVIGGYTPSVRNFDALIFGYYDRGHLMYASRTRNGFTPALRDQLLRQMRGLEISDCPFVNLPEKKSGRWGQGLTAAKMKGCRWLKPELVGQFEFVEWTPDGHLRHSRFVGLRTDKNAKDVVRE